MFTVKHYRRGGLVQVCACDSYEYQPESPAQIDLFSRAGGASVLQVGPQDSVYIENLSGKTVTAIRPKD